MAKWVVLDSKDNIEQFFDVLPKNFKNVSNFNTYSTPWDHGVYKYVEVIPAFDQKFEYLSHAAKVKTIDTFTVTYSVEKIPVSNAKQIALNEINTFKYKRLTDGVSFKENKYRSALEDTNLILSRLLAIQAGYRLPDNFCLTTLDNKQVIFTEEDLTQLNIAIFKYRDLVDLECNNTISLIQSAVTTEEIKNILTEYSIKLQS